MDPLDAIKEFAPHLVVWNCSGDAPLKYEALTGVPAVEVRCWGFGFVPREPARPFFVTTSPVIDPPGVPAVLVEGAGDDEVNGVYGNSGEQNFANDNSFMIWRYRNQTRDQWFIGCPDRRGGKAAYMAPGNADVNVPPQSGWHKADDGHGVPPSPSISFLGFERASLYQT
eukprot:CAMPEP_0204539578 /NCGR_PEP_ID=MMETSP0661-20131031/16839_1 /ASSEMBLY_ACC=CAM_ASM_000606 /TAXON_ID=109239 /ORGANISM="Alexandrium margalefi, Strain AMGDE01CS-322" /LENGTH=169 /DNA_ID=CAMNT_0051546193 /DNA_START=1 /DNA_END=506 /DNA_ORIENTATION=+